MFLAAQIGKAIVLGCLGYAAPRFLIAAGIPLDRWIEYAGGNADAMLWGFALIFLLVMFWLDVRFSCSSGCSMPPVPFA